MTVRRERLVGAASWRLTLGIALATLGFLVAAQLQSSAPRVRYTSQERGPLVEAVVDLRARQEELKRAILEERARISTLEETDAGSSTRVRSVNESLEVARRSAGLSPVRGPGLVVRLEDGIAGGADDPGSLVVRSRDVRAVVEELWLAGATAIEVNGERVVVSTAFLDVGGSVLANATYLTQPYDVAAVGPAGFYGRLLLSPGFADLLAARGGIGGIGIRHAELPEFRVAAYAGVERLRFGRPAAEAAR
ncbi:MAG: hypothetical protein RL338_1724 [Chloroflexota bacterium]